MTEQAIQAISFNNYKSFLVSAMKEFGAVVSSDRVQVPAHAREGMYFAQVTFRIVQNNNEKHILLTCQHYPCGNPDAGGEVCQEEENPGYLCTHMLAAVELYLQSYKESGSGMISKYAIRNAETALQTARTKRLDFGRIRPVNSGENDGFPIVWYPPVSSRTNQEAKQIVPVSSSQDAALAAQVETLQRQMAEMLSAMKGQQLPTTKQELTPRQKLMVALGMEPTAFCEFSDDDLRRMLTETPTEQPPKEPGKPGRGRKK